MSNSSSDKDLRFVMFFPFVKEPWWPPQNRPLVARSKAASDKTVFD
jgi:hypothetical protein